MFVAMCNIATGVNYSEDPQAVLRCSSAGFDAEDCSLDRDEDRDCGQRCRKVTQRDPTRTASHS
jgi:hypothetical protein